MCMLVWLSFRIEMMDVIYYYYYLFYTKYTPEDQPHSTVVFVLSLSESFIINGILEIFLAKKFCCNLSKWEMIGVFGLLIVVNYFVYYKSHRGKILIEKNPRFLGCHILSVIGTTFFFFGSLSFLFWGSDYVKSILDIECNILN